ncbi:aldehyde dehydrogenase, dimeric NADP-preferring-like [Galendromus occidentalis]|uniref:Aldehyde dehydrogenase n=1 Tax=Galendromus occidentalis TaxID=34638 RepID=A0AAJ6QV56_9ACAR|nr:aldehyde dehydrogenase, dimeric NADP-preferring-like [Galendromus occidentalis]
MATVERVKPFHLLQEHEKVQTRYTEDVEVLRKTFASGKTKSLAWRKDQIRKLQQFIEDHYEDLVNAAEKDIGKSRMESVLYEVEFVLNDIRGADIELEGWMKAESVPKTLMTVLDRSFVHSEPYGVALIIGAWNYPVQLVISPLVGAITAGNCAVIKTAELSPNTSKVMSKLTEYLDKEAFLLINGGVEEATEILKEKFDFIFYTGSVSVGKIIYAAAQKYLTPVTLELGGKSPVYVHSDVDLEMTVRRILWGKFVNAGQTCVAPDYVMCHESVHDKFISSTHKIIREFFGENPRESPDFARIVTQRHTKRLVDLLKDADIVLGGDADIEQRYLAPTVVQNVRATDPVMQEELFGPILPVLRVKNLDEAISFINARDKPLAAYVFAAHESIVSRFLNETSSGSACVNDVMVHLSVEGLPFGGVGSSGIGRYHGKHSFDCFSNKKAVLQRDFSWIGEAVGRRRYPPYKIGNIDFFKWILKRRKSYLAFTSILPFLYGTCFGLFLAAIYSFLSSSP